MVHIAKFWGVVPNSGHSGKLNNSTQDCLFWSSDGFKNFEEAVKYIKMYGINFAGILMRMVKLCVSMHVGAPSQTKVVIGKTIWCFSVVFHQALHQWLVYLLSSVPIDSSLVNAKLLSSQPQGQLLGLHSCPGMLLLFTFWPVLSWQPWLPFQWLDTWFLRKNLLQVT